MGCGGSKHDVQADDISGQKKPVSQENKPEIKIHSENKEEDEILVLQEGKSLSKSKLDQITEKNQSSSVDLKKVEKKEEKLQETHSKSLYDQRVENVNNEELSKGKTVKVEFEKHPHEFDFSYIDENKEKKDDDLLTDQILKEINEIS